MEYENMLNKAFEEMPSAVQERKRFEIPKVKGHLEGNRTVISNLNNIASTLNRPVQHLFKFLLRELATPGTIRGNRAILGTKQSASKINDKIRKYTEEFVLCKECGKPDTKLEKDGELVYLKCQACAASYTVKTRL